MESIPINSPANIHINSSASNTIQEHHYIIDNTQQQIETINRNRLAAQQRKLLHQPTNTHIDNSTTNTTNADIIPTQSTRKKRALVYCTIFDLYPWIYYVTGEYNLSEIQDTKGGFIAELPVDMNTPLHTQLQPTLSGNTWFQSVS